MANLVKTFTIPNALVPELVEVFGQNYTANITETNTDEEGNEITQEIPNPQTKAQFASGKFDEEIKQYVRRRVVEYRKVKARESVNGDFTF